MEKKPEGGRPYTTAFRKKRKQLAVSAGGGNEKIRALLPVNGKILRGLPRRILPEISRQ
jgi:hypothetical protein